MNEHIRDLALTVSVEYIASPVWAFTDSELEKFAQLIVRECIDVISPYAVRMENFDGGHPITDLKKHFGVEE